MADRLKVGDKEVAKTDVDGVSISGEFGISWTEERGRARTGDGGVSWSNYYGISVSGECGVSWASYEGRAQTGRMGVARSGNKGVSVAGPLGVAYAGVGGKAQAGEDGVIIILFVRHRKVHSVVGKIGQNGLMPNRPYELDEQGRFRACKSK